CQHSYGAPATF
nr:immunoglobulin light chain junction region [Macaca mulatta]MOW42662.1 immunoglobulin light chain junction region [Macaca mulatta]MOW43848.1 immunoglobulin light chain junction region [Macaca mulatta]MOW45140.1 immunoglobulin light chain junction region [Macaca mulatta]MOW45378.1 immunoglobulin light chain junction region [Macaca mulatta]